MKYIRIKVKHLLVILAAGLFILFTLVYLKGYILFGIGKISENAGNTNLAGAYYHRAAEGSLHAPSSVLAAKSRIEMLLKEKNLTYFTKINVTGSMTSGNGAMVNPYSIEEINIQYGEMLRTHKKNDAFAEYETGVALMNYFAGHADKALEVLQGMDYVRGKELDALRKLHLAAIFMSLGEMEKSLELLKAVPDENNRYGLIRKDLLKYCYFMTRDYNGFKNLKVDDSLRYKIVEKNGYALDRPFSGISNLFFSFNEIIESSSRLSNSGNTLSGRVTDNGKPLPCAIVYLQESALKNYHSSIIGMHDGIKRIVVTDKDGYFLMDNIPDGVYGIGIDIDWQRIRGKTAFMYKNYDMKFTGGTKRVENIEFIDTSSFIKAQEQGDGTIRFDFEIPVKADSYVLMLGEVRKGEDNAQLVNYIYHSDQFKTSPFILDVEKERKSFAPTGVSYGTDGIDPYYIMDPLYHTGDYAYYLYAYDKDGNTIYDSNGLYPNKKLDTVHIEGSEWNEADKLLLDKKFDEAIEAYKKRVLENSNDLHSIKVLANLYYHGWKFNEGRSELEGKDFRKAGEYFRMLDAQIENSMYVKESLGYIHVGLGEYEKAIEIYKGLAGANGYVNYQLARIYGYMGKFAQAAGYYEKYFESTGNGADMLLMTGILQNDTGTLRNYAGKHRYTGYYADYEKVINEYLKMDRGGYEKFYRLVNNGEIDEARKSIESDESDLAILYKALLVLQERIDDYRQEEELYDGFYKKVRNENIRELMKYFGKAGVNSGYGE